MIEKGRLIVVSGPSGAGKSTVVFKAINGRDKMCFSTSVTSRKPRPGEVDGREYFFIDAENNNAAGILIRKGGQCVVQALWRSLMGCFQLNCLAFCFLSANALNQIY